MAERSNFNDSVIDVEGNALANIKVTVTKTDGTSTPIYSGKTGGSKANEFLTTSNGQVDFWCTPGSYNVNYHDETIPARVSDKTFGFEAVSGDTSGVAGTQLDIADYVTQVMIKDNAVGVGELKIVADMVSGSSSTNGVATLCSKSLNPGLYLVFASATLGTNTVDTSGGTATIKPGVGQSGEFFGNTQMVVSADGSVVRLVSVVSGSTVRLRSTHSTTREGRMIVFGVEL